MSLIVAARFKTFEEAELAAGKLFAAGIQEDAVHIFFVSPSGPDKRKSAEQSTFTDPVSKGAVYAAVAGVAVCGIAGAVIGTVIALTLADSVIPIFGGAGIGAYLGSLGGALHVLGHRKTSPPALFPSVEERLPGVTLAVRVVPDSEKQVAAMLRDAGGQTVERAQGQWDNGKWVDFDPTSVSELEKNF